MADAFARTIEAVHARHRAVTDGALADYIPELTRADPAHFGIAVMTVDGRAYTAGDVEVPFTIQSVSKAFAYAMAIDEHGPAAVEARVDVEPSGEAFNSISLDPTTGRPRNPMINAGAIANLLRSFDLLTDPVDLAVEDYFRQCSIRVTCHDLAVMASTLARNGTNPITGEVVVDATSVERALSVMSTCGMYDYSGTWMYEVGIPAKSGVGGGVIGVLPGQFGFAEVAATRGRPAADNEQLADIDTVVVDLRRAGTTDGSTASLDDALLRCEEALLGSTGGPDPAALVLDAGDFELTRYLGDHERARLLPRLTPAGVPAGTVIIEQGTDAEALYLLAAGVVRVSASEHPGGPERRISDLYPGVVFGELGVLQRAQRSATVRAVTDVVCYVLTREELMHLRSTDHLVYTRIIEHLLVSSAERLRRTSREVTMLRE